MSTISFKKFNSHDNVTLRLLSLYFRGSRQLEEWSQPLNQCFVNFADHEYNPNPNKLRAGSITLARNEFSQSDLEMLFNALFDLKSTSCLKEIAALTELAKITRSFVLHANNTLAFTRNQ